MTIKRISKAGGAGLLVFLAACSGTSKLASQSQPQPYASDTPTATGAARAPISGQRSSFDNVESYKADVAEQVMRYNTAHTFSGRLPPMLPAIVVLTITVDKTGKLTHVAVQRSRDNDASKVALASMRRVGQLPKPFNLATGAGKSMTFSETFLFNADYRFQLRTLAPIQRSD
ncbi:MAG: energy transducer TonB [Massilia sp.]|nr:energy transducer TonB [Massilia sp.]